MKATKAMIEAWLKTVSQQMKDEVILDMIAYECRYDWNESTVANILDKKIPFLRPKDIVCSKLIDRVNSDASDKVLPKDIKVSAVYNTANTIHVDYTTESGVSSYMYIPIDEYLKL